MGSLSFSSPGCFNVVSVVTQKMFNICLLYPRIQCVMCNVLENKFTQLLADDSGVTFSVSYFIMWDETWLNPLLIVSCREVILVLAAMVEIFADVDVTWNGR